MTTYLLQFAGSLNVAVTSWGHMLMTGLQLLWAASTVLLVSLVIYRNTLRFHEDDQLFLDDAEVQFAKEQEQLSVRIEKLHPWLFIFGAGSAFLLVIVAGLEIASHLRIG